MSRSLKLVVTGGGTGGHVYPALEVARLAREEGAILHYIGSFRGIESDACERAPIPFTGIDVSPIIGFRSLKGVRGAVRLALGIRRARNLLKTLKPDVVLSSGGYSAGPVVLAARGLGIPYVLQDANAVPGRANRMVAKQAYAVATVFRHATTYLPGANVVRTGMPIRKRLRAASEAQREPGTKVLVLGGSQGSRFLNHSVPETAKLGLIENEFVHVAGPKNAAEVRERTRGIENYDVRPFLEADDLAEAYQQAAVVVCRSGGGIAELAMFRIPSVLAPLPTAADDHQTYNALEFVEMGAATLMPEREFTPEAMARAIRGWLTDSDCRASAMAALSGFDVPDATERIWRLLVEAAG